MSEWELIPLTEKELHLEALAAEITKKTSWVAVAQLRTLFTAVDSHGYHHGEYNETYVELYRDCDELDGILENGRMAVTEPGRRRARLRLQYNPPILTLEVDGASYTEKDGVILTRPTYTCPTYDLNDPKSLPKLLKDLKTTHRP